MKNTKRNSRVVMSLLCLVAVGLLGGVPLYGQVTRVVPVTSGDRLPMPPFGFNALGKSIGIDEDTLVVGFGNTTDFSGALLFHRENGVWAEEVPPSQPSSSENFGNSVAIDGARVIVGAPFGEIEPREYAYVWERIGTLWQALAPIANGPLQVGFGAAVDISGDTVVVSAPQAFASIYHYDGVGWNEQWSMSASASGPGLGFGFGLAIDGDVAVVGDSLSSTAQVSVARRNGIVWTVAETFTVMDMGTLAAQGYVEFGRELALDGDTLLVSVRGFDPLLDDGVCVLRDTGSGFTFVETLFGGDTIKADGFGTKIDLDGDNAIIAAPLAQGGGAAYLFVRNLNGFAEQVKYVSNADGIAGGSPLFGIDVAISETSVAFGSLRDVSPPNIGAALVREGFNSPSVIQAFCAGNGNAGPTCANCPCSNNAPSFSFGGCTNSTGTSAVLAMSGEASFASDTMRLEVSHATPNSLAILTSGDLMLPLQPAAGCSRGTGVTSLVFDGLRCVGGVTRRHGARATDPNGRAGSMTDGWGGPFAPSAGLVAQGGFAVGQNRFLQAIYRDNANAGCGTGLNTSNAIAVLVIP